MNKTAMTVTEQTVTTNIGIILLAAGASSRLGQPKQLLPYHGASLLQHSLRAALAAPVQPVLVVLGARANEIKSEAEISVAQVVVNEGWQEGMASSIRCGVKKLQEMAPATEAVILMVCDQPFVSPGLLNEIITAHQRTGKHIVACSYENSFGPPVLFQQSYFPDLLQLQGDVGARSIISRHLTEAELLPFPQGAIDVDTTADYENIKQGL